MDSIGCKLLSNAQSARFRLLSAALIAVFAPYLDASAQVNGELPALEVAILFDDSGSMFDEIEELQANVAQFALDVQDLLSECTSAVRFGLISFSDEVVTHSDLTADVDSLVEAVLGLEALSGNPCGELSLDAVFLANNTFSWSENSLRIYLMVTDEPANFRGDGTLSSLVTMDETVSLLLQTAARMFTVSPYDLVPENTCDYSAFDDPLLEIDVRRLATSTGGIDFDIDERSIGEVLDDLLMTIQPEVTGTIEPAPDQPNPTAQLPISFRVLFTEPVDGFDSNDSDDTDVIFEGTAAVGSYVITGSGAEYILSVTSVAGSGTVLPVIPDGVVSGALCFGPNRRIVGAPVIFDVEPTQVTISRAPGQPHFTNQLPAFFEVIFDDFVTGFDANNLDDLDVIFLGTTNVQAFEVTGSGNVYTVVVTDVAGDGTIEPIVPEGVTDDPLGNTNASSINIDNIVVIDRVAPTPTIDLAEGQATITNRFPIEFDIVFDERVADFFDRAPSAQVLRFVGGATGIQYQIVADPEFDAEIRNGSFEFGNLEHWNTTSLSSFGTFFATNSQNRTPLGTHTTVGPSEGEYFAVSDQTGANAAVLYQEFQAPHIVGGDVLLHFSVFVDSVGTGEFAFVNGPLDSLAPRNQYGTADLLRPDADALTPSAQDLLMNFYEGVDPGARPVSYTRYTFDITPLVRETDGRLLLRFGQVATQATFNIDTNAFMNMGVDDVELETVYTGSYRKYRLIVTNATGSGAVIPTLPVGAGADLATNDSNAYTTPQRMVIYDPIPPRIRFSTPSVFETALGPVEYTIEYEGAQSVTLSASNVSLVTTGTASGSVLVSGTGNTQRLVTVTDLSGTGTIAIRIAEGTAIDAAGNRALATNASAPFEVDPGLASVLTVSTTSIAFSATPLQRHTDRTLTVSNTGGGPLEGAANAMPPFMVTTGSPYVLGPGESQTVVIRFAPESVGQATGIATFSGGGGAVISLSGEGLPADASQIFASPAQLRWGNVAIGETRNAQVLIVNNGSETLSGEASIPQPFAVVSGSPYNILAGQNALLGVRFRPTEVREYSATLVLTGGGGTQITMNGNALPALGELTGQITAAGDPIANASIALFQNSQLLARAVTDTSGGYTLRDLPVGGYNAVAQAAGFISGARLVDVTQNGNTANFDLQARTAQPEIAGTIADANHEDSNLGGIIIEVTQDGEVLATTVSGVDGTYEIDLEDVTGEIVIAIRGNGFQNAEFTHAVQEGIDASATLERDETETGQFRGTLMNDLNGAAISNAQVSVSIDGVTWQTRSGPDGAFAFGDLPTGFAEVFIDAQGFEPFTPMALTIFAGDTTPAMNLALEATQVPMEGEGEGEPDSGCAASTSPTGNVFADFVLIFTVGFVLALRKSYRRLT